MKKQLFSTAVCLERQICYYLLSEDDRYGVGVEYREESAHLPGLTGAISCVEALLQAMTRGCVTPVTAQDVAEDWLQSGNH